ncbi:hypothetical protein N9I84_02825 [Gammaproteobacteria bacterium]|nr:hypothetical protein [Gammaproteobacteria bacterium]MDA7851842.1 hypothetical protein [Gammaproteobacteria bacterium]MDA8924997.1 hypothetical protein [Gammaproteobacteria bacterium]MDA9048884.1 hypothetical protein [Gammaproteobacteria bacterium]MDA9340467.1 hypothetical protein [Gammaproteobacteria bacterium]|tara:strand:+ start:3764 stop:4051 length:288 start_codon:yes stop_codon:yes gene_type:complete
MQYSLLTLLLLSPLVFAEDQRLVSELSITELKEIVRDIVEESIEKCTVSGTMNGRAKVNLRVEGEVLAQMDCIFEDAEKVGSPSISKVEVNTKIN